MRLIDADSVKEKMKESTWTLDDGTEGDMVALCAINGDIGIINREPTIDAEPVVHAHWQEGHKYKRLRTCSNCGGQPDQNPFADNLDNSWATSEFEYCPYCGAKMDEEDTE